MANEEDLAGDLASTFNNILEKEYGGATPPPPYITRTGIRTLDAILGGGLSSSLPINLNSAPEVGKSTFAFQMTKRFQEQHEESIVVYFDIESASDVGEGEDGNSSVEDRVKVFEINTNHFMYKPLVLDVKQTFELISQLIEKKKEIEKKKNKEIKVFFVWDSISATPSSKDYEAEDPDRVIGYKARELTFSLSKYKPLLSMNRITLLFIDQVRSNIKQNMNPMQRKASNVAEFNDDYKAATGTSSFQHNIRQWLFIEKGKQLTPDGTFGKDGWIQNIKIIKNKLAPSQVDLPVVFDKKYGIDPLYSEYYFMSEMTSIEKKFTKNNESKLPVPLCVETDKKSKIIHAINPKTGEIEESTEKFMERNLRKKYEEDENFKRIFDKAVDYAVEGRIKKGLFRMTDDEEEKETEIENQNLDPSQLEEDTAELTDSGETDENLE